MNTTTEYSIAYEKIAVTGEEVSKVIGYASTEIPEMVRLIIEEIQVDIGKYSQIKGGYRLFNHLQIRDELMFLEGSTFELKKIIASSLAQADSIAVFVCTAGEKLSNWAQHFFNDNDPVKAYIIDIAASLVVEKAADQVQESIARLASANQKQITNRYSPGYCGWNVSEQHQLLALLPDQFCGVSLNEAALMNPVKSVSGIIGIGPRVKKVAYRCNQCEKSDCLLAHNQSL